MFSINIKNEIVSIDENLYTQSIGSMECADTIFKKRTKKLYIPKNNFSKNYQILPIKNQYILKNLKNSALIDNNVYHFLEPFNKENMPKELLKILYQLDFLIDANH